MPKGFYPRHTKAWQERLWDNIKLAPGDSCWVYAKAKSLAGYGVGSKFHTPTLAHRMAWESSNGPISKGLCVLHKCDNPPCCRPDHLFLGTKTDNVVDKVLKGRQARGETHGMAKLKEAQVISTRSLAATKSPLELALQFKVSPALITEIISGRRWKHIDSTTSVLESI